MDLSQRTSGTIGLTVPISGHLLGVVNSKHLEIIRQTTFSFHHAIKDVLQKTRQLPEVIRVLVNIVLLRPSDRQMKQKIRELKFSKKSKHPLLQNYASPYRPMLGANCHLPSLSFHLPSSRMNKLHTHATPFTSHCPFFTSYNQAFTCNRPMPIKYKYTNQTSIMFLSLVSFPSSPFGCKFVQFLQMDNE